MEQLRSFPNELQLLLFQFRMNFNWSRDTEKVSDWTEDENMYPYNYIQIYLAQIVNRIEFKKNKHIWIENIYV